MIMMNYRLTLFLSAVFISLHQSKPESSLCDHRPICRMFCANGFLTDDDGCPICRCKEGEQRLLNLCEEGYPPLKNRVCDVNNSKDSCPFTYECVLSTTEPNGICCPDQIGRLLMKLINVK